MGYQLEINSLLVVPKGTLDLHNLRIGETYQLVKDKERLYPLNIPIEMCDDEYNYYGKVAVRKLTLESGKTTLEIEVLKIFGEQEAEVYTRNFIRP